MLPLFPIREHDVYDLYIDMRSKQWNETKLIAELKKDKGDLDKLDKKTRKILEKTLGFLGLIDIVINKNISLNYKELFPEIEFQVALNYQAFIEDIHQITYSKFIMIYFDNNIDKRNKLLNSMEKDKHVKRKIDWLLGNIKRVDNNDKARKVIIFTLTEGMSIFGAFAIVFWFRENGLLQGFTKANEYIFKDEKDHVKMGVLMYKRCERMSQFDAHELAKEMLDLEIKFYGFVEDGLPGMTYKQLVTFLKYRTDTVMEMLGYAKIYNVKNPLRFIDKQDIGVRSSSFFTSVGTDYVEKNYDKDDLDLSFSDE